MSFEKNSSTRKIGFDLRKQKYLFDKSASKLALLWSHCRLRR